MKYYELHPDELEEALCLRNSIFSNVDTAHWNAMNCTGVVARADDEVDESDRGTIVGFIPLQYRSQVMRPGVVAPVVYENAVGVAEPYRSMGIGSAMIDEASRFIGDRADAMFVIRGGESTTGYRFYRKSGHSDLCYAVSYLIDSESAPRIDCGSVVEVDRGTWFSREADLHRLYADTYRECGGYSDRTSGFWRSIFDGHVFKSRVWRLYVDGNDTLNGYAVVVAGSWRDLDVPHIYELVGRDDAVERILRRICDDSEGPHVRIPSVSLENPIRNVIETRGWGSIVDRSEPQIMTRIVEPSRLFGRLVDATAGADRFVEKTTILCSTPHRSIVLSDPGTSEPSPDRSPAGSTDRSLNRTPEERIELEMKEHALARLLCCRLDLRRALELEMVRCRGGSDRSLDTLASILSPAPWAQWFTDYV